MQHIACPNCNDHVRPKLVDDFPGCHIYVYSCRGCFIEFPPEWTQFHHGVKELPPILFQDLSVEREISSVTLLAA